MVEISNRGKTTVQLKTRHWRITDGFGRLQEVRAENKKLAEQQRFEVVRAEAERQARAGNGLVGTGGLGEDAERLGGLAYVPMRDIDESVRMLREAAALGFTAVNIPGFPQNPKTTASTAPTGARGRCCGFPSGCSTPPIASMSARSRWRCAIPARCSSSCS